LKEFPHQIHYRPKDYSHLTFFENLPFLIINRII
jgi:hypothetical protein